MNALHKNYYDLFRAIEDSIDNKRFTPALILIYSGIDSFSFLASISSKNGRTVFKEWVKEWMLKKYPLPCNETDIYSARCGLLHQQTSKSDLSNKGEAKEIYYTWGNANLEALQYSLSSIGKCDKIVAVKIEDLMWSFRRGMVDCMSEINKNVNWKNIYDAKARNMFNNIPHEEE